MEAVAVESRSLCGFASGSGMTQVISLASWEARADMARGGEGEGSV